MGMQSEWVFGYLELLERSGADGSKSRTRQQSPSVTVCLWAYFMCSTLRPVTCCRCRHPFVQAFWKDRVVQDSFYHAEWCPLLQPTTGVPGLPPHHDSRVIHYIMLKTGVDTVQRRLSRVHHSLPSISSLALSFIAHFWIHTPYEMTFGMPSIYRWTFLILVILTGWTAMHFLP